MSDLRITIVGQAELAAKLAALGARAGDVIETALHAGAQEIQNAAIEKAPVRSGSLRRSITIETVKKDARGAEVVVGPTEPHGKWQEFGTGIYAVAGNGRKTPWTYRTAAGEFITTRGNRPQPFMRPAFDEQRENAVNVVREELAAQLEAL